MCLLSQNFEKLGKFILPWQLSPDAFPPLWTAAEDGVRPLLRNTTTERGTRLRAGSGLGPDKTRSDACLVGRGASYGANTHLAAEQTSIHWCRNLFDR